ncbi:MAG: tail fiber domain-containing protein [Flavobacteriales bacterium]|nr:tail fiber domain-containing protein [Flavobacteriales bacterium]
MKTKKMMRPIAMAACMLALVEAHAQTSVLGNNPGTPGTDYVGWDNSTTVPLMIRHNANQPIGWFTDSIQRMRLNQTASGAMLNGFNGLDLSGYLTISGNPAFFNQSRAFSRLHLADTAGAAVINAQAFAFRPWQRNGITFTGNADHGYMGQEHNGRDTTDMVIMWSNDFGVGQFAPDHLSIRFASNFTAAQTGASSMRGLEAMRFFPADRNRVLVGVGDFIAGNVLDPLVTEPTEILDVLSGRVRIRQLPSDSAAVDSFYVMVVDRTLGNERGVVKWVDPNELPGGGADCDWEITATTDVVTAYLDPQPTTDCPGVESRVGIGISMPESKLHVVKDLVIDPWNDRAGAFHNRSNANYAVGVEGLSDTENPMNIGVLGQAYDAGRTIGVRGLARSEGSSMGVRGEATGLADNYGAEGHATGGQYAYGVQGSASQAVINNYGVVGTGSQGLVAYGGLFNANGADGINFGIRATASGNSAHAGWFDGDVQITGDLWNNTTMIFSDGTLKTNVEDLTGALDRVLQLAPKTYWFDQSLQPQMNLPTAPQIGFIAQEVEAVVPEVVGSKVYPAQYDSTGAMISPAYPLRGIDYAKLVPVLVGAVQEQQQMIHAMQTQLQEMQTALANCCAHPGNDADQRGGSIDNSQLSDPATERLLTIAPNPFTDRTTVSYTLERGGRAQLLVNSSDGKHLQVLEEGVRSEGQYNYTWSTSHLAPGVYYVTLLLDGEPLVKRAVKVQ